MWKADLNDALGSARLIDLTTKLMRLSAEVRSTEVQLYNLYYSGFLNSSGLPKLDLAIRRAEPRSPPNADEEKYEAFGWDLYKRSSSSAQLDVEETHKESGHSGDAGSTPRLEIDSDTRTGMPLRCKRIEPHPEERWDVVYQRTFNKALRRLDVKMQERIRAAVRDLVETPLEARGDTIQPLSNNQKGLWRYRIGNFRMLFYPNRELRTIVIVDLDTRDRVYH